MRVKPLYKLTDCFDRTHGGCQWGENVEVRTDGTGKLCGPGFTHWYTDPLLAVLLNPIHARFGLATAHLWEGEGDVAKTDHGLKVGCTWARTLHRIEVPRVSLEQRAEFAIRCSLVVCNDPDYVRWAQNWLSGADRTAAKAWAAAKQAEGRAAWTAWVAAKSVAAAAEATEAAAAVAETAAEVAETALGTKIDLVAIALFVLGGKGANRS